MVRQTIDVPLSLHTYLLHSTLTLIVDRERSAAEECQRLLEYMSKNQL